MGIHMTDAYDCHVYLIDGQEELALIDAGAGMGVDDILKNIEDHGFNLSKLKYLILTHAHADHAGGAKRIREKTGVEVIAHPITADYLERGDEEGINLSTAKRAGFYPMDYRFESCEVGRKVKEGEKIQVGVHTLKVIETPGHCEGHLSFLMETEERNYLFSGDLVFFDGKVAIQYINDCDVFSLGKSLKKLEGLKIDTMLSGHDLFVLKEAQKHIDKAINTLERLAIPPSIIY